MLKVDFHTHTAEDPEDRIPHSTVDLIDRASNLEFDAIALTLHNRQLDLTPYRDYADDRGVVLIPGTERTIEGRHVLLLNFSAATEEVATFADLARLKRQEPGGLVIAPHPFFPALSALRGAMNRHADLFDVVEYNAMFTSLVNFNALAEGWATRHGKPMVGNGDVHRLEQLGTTYSVVDAAPDPDAICAAVRAGRVCVVSRPLSILTAGRIMTDLLADCFLPNRVADAAASVLRSGELDLAG